ncbi:phosphatidylinositol 3-phosphate phosphatase [Pyronema domesticum]|nr:phosphatidylinositol 3-phosphate phosphatase [Pyronema domesticum]
MEHIRVAKVENVSILHRGEEREGTLHLTAHHMIFKGKADIDPTKPGAAPNEMWIAYPIIGICTRHPSCASAPAHIRLRNRDFSVVQIRFTTDRECREVFDSIRNLTVIKGGVEKLYAFFYQPVGNEKKCNGWKIYNPLKELQRMGVGTERVPGWRITDINKDLSFSPTYPAVLAVPSSISDTTLGHAKNFRSRERIPALTYIHPLNNCTITRCAQPMTGMRGNRSVQDEKLVAAIFASSQPPGSSQTPQYLRNATPSPSASAADLQALNKAALPPTSEPDAALARIYGAQQQNLIVDARPAINARLMQMAGMGTEEMENYKHCSSPPCNRIYLGIDNIHVMRGSLNKVIEAIKDSDISPLPPNRELLAKSGWLKHISTMLEGTDKIVRQVALNHSHVLLHCSDGWDRTSQLSSLAQICLDPYFRTIDGFICLVEKDWCSFGHRFRDRSGFLGHEKWFVEKSVYGQQANEDDDRGGAAGGAGAAAAVLGEAFGEAFGHAKNFFNTISSGNGRSVSPIEGDDDDTERRTKIARAAETPMSTTPKEVSPIFQQFLDGTFQLMLQYPTRFEYNERFLRRLLYHLYSCQYGTFLHNNEKERLDSKVKERTRSVWDYFMVRRKMFTNEEYNPDADGDEHVREVDGGRVIYPKYHNGDVKWWAHCWGRTMEEMNGPPILQSGTPLAEMGGREGSSPEKVAGGGGSFVGNVPSLAGSSLAGSSVPSLEVGNMVDGVKGLMLGAGGFGTPARKRSAEELGTEMM